MKRFWKWIAGVAGTAAVILLVVVLFPYAKDLAGNISGKTQINSVALKQKLASSERLETVRIEEEGTISAGTSVIILGEIGRTTMEYFYKTILGLDLSKVDFHISGNQIIFTLPDLEILNDSIEKGRETRNNFISFRVDKDSEELLKEKQQELNYYFLTNPEKLAEEWEKTEKAFTESVGKWVQEAGGNGYTILLERKGSE